MEAAYARFRELGDQHAGDRGTLKARNVATVTGCHSRKRLRVWA